MPCVILHRLTITQETYGSKTSRHRTGAFVSDAISSFFVRFLYKLHLLCNRDFPTSEGKSPCMGKALFSRSKYFERLKTYLAIS